MKSPEPPESISMSHPPVGRWWIWAAGGVLGLFALVLLVSQCGHSWEYDEKLSGGYVLRAVDVRAQMNISRLLPSGDAVGVISATVFAAGWNSDFIIARRRESGASQSANFYLLRVADGESWGPLTEAQFQAERERQGVPRELGFSRVFQDLQ